MDGLRVAKLKITQLKFPSSDTTISRRESQKSS
jgi:hypothetical protein